MAVKTKRTVIKGMWGVVDYDTGLVGSDADGPPYVFNSRKVARDELKEIKDVVQNDVKYVVRKVNVTITPAD